MSTRRVHRYDAPGKIKLVETPEGFLLTTGKIAKPGVMTYQQADGSILRELVEADVLSHDGSNGTLYAKAVAHEHPDEDVTPDNWSTHAHGTVGYPEYDAEHEDGPGLYTRVHVHTRQMLELLRSDSGPRELSPGYTVEIDDTPGEHPEFGPYDTRQLPGTRRYNHLALTQSARGGRDLTLHRKDSAIEVHPMDPEEEKTEDATDLEMVPVPEEAVEPMTLEGIATMLEGLESRIAALEGGRADDEDEEEDDAPKEDGRTDSFLAAFNAHKGNQDVAKRLGLKGYEALLPSDLERAIVKAVAPDENRKDSTTVKAFCAILRSTRLKTSYDKLGRALMAPDRKDAKDDVPASVPSQDDFFKNLSK